MIYEFLKKRKDDLSHIAISYQNNHVSYAMLYQNIFTAATQLKQLGVKEKDRVLLFLPNSIHFVVYFFAIELLNATAVLCDIKFEDEVKIVVRDCNIRTIITDNFSVDKLYGKNLHNLTIINLDNESIKESRGSMDVADVEDLNREAMILYTSGTTGKIKGVRNTYATILAAVQHYTATLELTEEDIMIGVIPFYHSYGFGSCMMAGLSKGAHIVLFETFIPNMILKSIFGYRATVFHGIPYMYDLIIKQLTADDKRLRSLKYCISAGAPLTRGIAEQFYKLTGLIIHQEYGSSETGTISLNIGEDLEKNISSVGKPLYGVDVQIQVEDNTILISSESIAKGYIGEAEAPFPTKKYNTCDIGYLDEEGYIYISGREKRMINIDGLKVNADQIEEIIKQHPEIIDVHVTSGKNDEGKVHLIAYAVKSNNKLTEKDIVVYCQKHVAAYKIPKVIQWVEKLNRSSSGKVREEQ